MDNPSLSQLDSKPIELNDNEVIALSCVRNEGLRLPFFLDYHRNLGVDRFIFVDNASTDGSESFLLAQEDVHVFSTDASYAQSRCGVDWINELLEIYGIGRWVLTLDADELLVYPWCETIGLRELTDFLDLIRSDALVTFLLDMYSEKSISESKYERGRPFLETCRYFDGDSYHEKDVAGIPIRGGPRHRLFWDGRGRQKPSPVLKKTPLVKWRKGLEYEASTHVIRGVNVAPVTGVLQHFKFFSDFCATVARESERKEHWDGAAQYSAYWEVLKKDAHLTAMYENSLSYENSVQLVELGLLKCTSEYEQFVRTRNGDP